MQRSEIRSQRSEKEASTATDLLDDDGEVTVFRGDWIDAPNVRGTGCMLSSAIACGLAKGDELKQAVSTAKQFVTKTINDSKFKIQNSKLKAIRS
jgi:hydroxymethylpyrimidine/phosphomethylpyrimidine kinase